MLLLKNRKKIIKNQRIIGNEIASNITLSVLELRSNSRKYIKNYPLVSSGIIITSLLLFKRVSKVSQSHQHLIFGAVNFVRGHTL